MTKRHVLPFSWSFEITGLGLVLQITKLPMNIPIHRLKKTRPQNHVNCIKMVKIGVILANFFGPTSVTKWEVQNIGLFLPCIPLINALFHFHGCSSSANIRIFAISNTGLSFFPLCNELWDSVVTKTVGFTLGSILFN